jgi:hypothetical protein
MRAERLRIGMNKAEREYLSRIAALGWFDLVTVPMARRTDPETSHAAAESARELATRHHHAIITALRVHGPMGKDAIARRLGLTGVMVARRLPELERQGRAMPTGRTVTSDTGRQEREWCAI